MEHAGTTIWIPPPKVPSLSSCTGTYTTELKTQFHRLRQNVATTGRIKHRIDITTDKICDSCEVADAIFEVFLDGVLDLYIPNDLRRSLAINTRATLYVLQFGPCNGGVRTLFRTSFENFRTTAMPLGYCYLLPVRVSVWDGARVCEYRDVYVVYLIRLRFMYICVHLL